MPEAAALRRDALPTHIPAACLCPPPEAQGLPYLALTPRCAAGPSALPRLPAPRGGGSPLTRVRGLCLARTPAAAGRGWEHPLCARGEEEGVSQETCISAPDLAPLQLREVLLKTPAGSFAASPLPERRDSLLLPRKCGSGACCLLQGQGQGAAVFITAILRSCPWA